MWKEKFTLKVDAHPEDGMQTVEVSKDGDYWSVIGLVGENLRLPADDNVLAQIMDVCQQIIDHVDNPLNFQLRSGSEKNNQPIESPADPTEPFECCWCKEIEEAYAKSNGFEPDRSAFVYLPDQHGGWDSESKLPICDGCADSAREDMETDGEADDENAL